MSKPRSQKPKIDNNLNIDEPSLTTPVVEGTDADSLPFSEWSDQDINLEKWDNVPVSKDKSVQNQQKLVFEDPHEIHLPPSLGAHQWKRCSEIFTNVNFTIFVNKSTYPDLVTPNHHILHSEFYRSFISSIETLLYIGSSKPFPEEYGNPAYNAPVDRSWRPWYHIYSNCKIVKGHNEHVPLYNPTDETIQLPGSGQSPPKKRTKRSLSVTEKETIINIYKTCLESHPNEAQTERVGFVSRASGKYVVRLYWMGTWRKIFVDDLIPVDQAHAILLPSLHVPKIKSESDIDHSEKPIKGKSKGGDHVKKEIVELWPMILCKALLKIGALSWSIENELYDFDIINCLTGWIPQKIKINGIPSSDLWDILLAYVERFEWEETKEESAKKTGSSKSKSKEKDKAELSSKGTKGVKATIPSGIENMRDGNRFIVASCDNFKTMVNTNALFQNRNIPVFLSQIRTIPIIKPPPRPELELWKKFRYEEWAVERGIIPPDIEKLNIKSLKIVDPFKRISQSCQEIEKSEENTLATQNTETTDKKSEKSSKSSKKEAKGKTTKHYLEPDPTMWMDFDEIKININHVTIYFQPRSFKAKTKISDINFSNKSSEFKHIIYSNDLKKIRNEPLYMFMDSIDYKMLLINCAQIGDISKLEKHIEETDADGDVSDSDQNQDICMQILIKKTELQSYVGEPLRSASQLSTKSMFLCNFNTKPIEIVLEEYSWDKNSFGEATGTIKTVGNKSLLLDLKPGRKSFRIWILSQCSYVLQVFSDTPVIIGCLEEYILACTAESQLLTNLCYELSSCYGKLVQSFGMPEYSISLRNFYQCYKPFKNLTKEELVVVHKTLFEEFCKVIIDNSSVPKAIDCIRLLFLQLKTYDYINPYQEEPHLYLDTFLNTDQIEYAKYMQRAAVKIQAFFKGVYIRLSMKKLNENHKQYFDIFDCLKKIYSEIFAFDKRLNYCPILFRKYFERQDMATLKEKFEVYANMESVLDTQVFTNTLVIQELCWVPICRYEFHINCVDPIFIKINLFSNLNNFYVRVFDNDTQKEIKRYTNNVAVEAYDSNINGYTILCYAWADDNTKINWKLVLATKKMSRNDLIIVPSIPLATLRLKDNYMPNFENIICKYIVKVGSDASLTAHLTTSYDQVKICLKLTDSDGKTLHEIYGVGSALLPAISLQPEEEPNSNIIVHKKLKNRISVQSGHSDITYSKLHKKHGSYDTASIYSGSIRSGSYHKKVSVASNVSGSGGKHHKKRSSVEGVDSEGDVSSHQSERSQDPDEKIMHKKKKNHGDHSDADSISEKVSKRSSVRSKSLDKISQRSLPQGKSRGGSRQESPLNKVVENVQTEYILEAIVIEDSWPLTAEEWHRVQRLREKSYLNLFGERKSSIIKKNLMNNPMEEPFWILDLVHAPGDSLEFEQDNSKSENRNKMKIKWFEDINRYKRGMELREAYLQEHLVFNDSAIREINVRSNNPHDFAVRIVEEPSTRQFMISPPEEVDEDTCKTKEPDDYLIEECEIDQALREFGDDERAMLDDIQDFLQDQTDNFKIMSQWFSGIRNDSAEMTLEALKIKNDFVKKVLESKTKTKGDKSRKGKKKK